MKIPANIHFLLPLLFPRYIWRIPGNGKKIYLTFDDGPHPVATPFILDLLKKFNASATFFCIGKHVEKYPGIYRRILDEGHAVGNHTQTHPDGWRTPARNYLSDVETAKKAVGSALFRPPYGRLTPKQAKALRKEFAIIMWSAITHDYDALQTPAACTRIALKAAVPGAIIVFHDSDKAWPRLRESLPAVMESLEQKGFLFAKIPASL